MSRIQKLGLCSFLLGLLLSLFFLNRDIQHFEYIHPYAREFSAENYLKGEYLLTDEITFKPGSYFITFSGETDNIGNGFYLLDSDDEVWFSSDFPVGELTEDVGIEVTGGIKRTRIGVRYDPANSTLRIESIKIWSDNVLYSDSLLRHALLSFCLMLLFVLLVLRFVFVDVWRRWFQKISSPEYERGFVFLLALTLFSLYPFLGQRDYIFADDMQFHLSRIEGIAASLKAGYFPARIHLFVIQNYGYGSGFFYPDLLLYFPALLRLCGFSIMSVYKIYVALCSFLSIVTTFYVAKRIAHSSVAGYVAAILFAFSAYRMIDVFYRGALGEIQSFIFLPLIVLGLYEIFDGRPQRWPIFAFGFCGLTCSHLISLMIAGCVTALFLLFNIVRILRSRQIMLALCKAVGVTLCFSAFFFLPMIEQILTNEVTANLLLSALPGEISPSRVLAPRYLLSFFEPWINDSVYPGWTFLLIVVLRLCLFSRRADGIKVADVMLGFGLLAMFMCTSLFPWQILVWFFNRIQFSWRMMLVTTCLLPIAGGIIFSALFRKDTRRQMALVGLFCFCAFCAEPVLYETMNNRTVRDMDFVLQNNRLGGAEYLPRWLSVEYIDKTRNTVLSDVAEMQITAHDRRGLSFTFSYILPQDSNNCTFIVPLVAYTGYKAEFIESNGERRALPVEKNEQGLVQISLADEPEGNVHVWYAKTTVQLISEIISLLTILIVVFFLIKKLTKSA